MKRQFSEIEQQGVWTVIPEGRKTNKGGPQPRPRILPGESFQAAE